MNKIFGEHMGKLLEVYIDDMLLKTSKFKELIPNLQVIFDYIRKHNMCLNPQKCTFVVETGKFLGFMLTYRGIEANPKKCRAILDMKSPNSIKEIQRLIGRLASLSRFLSVLARKSLPLFALLRKQSNFEWNEECKATFQDFKQYLAKPSILTKLEPDNPLTLYLLVGAVAIGSILVKEIAEEQKSMYYTSRAVHGPEI